MVYTINNLDQSKKLLVYSETVLLIDKNDEIDFVVKNEHFDYTIKFSFSNEGEKYSTTFWHDKQNKLLHYKLNNWDSNSYVEISKPIILEIDDLGKFLLKFRNQSLESKEHRKFTLTIWKSI